MSRSQQITAAAVTALCGAGIYCFFALRYPYHLHFQEQYQLFQDTWAYFAGVASVPGGLADWLGRFLTQFFYYAPAGAAILAVLLCAVQLLCWALCRARTPLLYALSLLPALLLLLFCCDENALPGAAVALALSLGAAALCRLVRKAALRRALELLLVPLLYMACGPLTLLFVLVTLTRELSDGPRRRALPFAAAALVLLALCPLVAARLFPYPLGRLVRGVHYFRYHNVIPALLWLAVPGAWLPVLLSCFKGVERVRGMLPGLAAGVLIGGGGAFLTLRSADQVKEEWMRYDFMVRMQMWNRIMLQADKHNPSNPTTVSCLNLALAQTGRLPGSQFQYFQNGPEGLIPEYRGDHTNPVPTGEIFWHLGMVNTAQRYAFEAQEAIPDFQKSARLYKRLAETNIVNGDWPVARKYLKVLQHALFYKAWARETLTLLDNGQIFQARPQLARALDFRLKEHDFLFSGEEMDSMLGLLKVENPQNGMALDYLLSWCLLRKDLDRFAEVIGLLDAPVLPKSYQEALLLRWVLTHQDFNGLPPYLAPAHAQRLGRFITDYHSGREEARMRRDYGDTYWFYYYYRYRSQ